jgi:predicted phosphodiesterase
MTGKTVVVLSCGHSDPSVPNDRYSWLGDFLYDLKPDYVVDLGDGADMRSLNTFDTRYPQAIVSQSYQGDIEHYNDAMERMRWKFKQYKRKRPFYIGFEGNHENRIKKAIAHDPRLEGSRYGISFGHLQTSHWFDEYHEYTNSAPALADYDGIIYGHYVASGNFGSAMATKHHGYSLVEKLARSATVGHTHKFNYYYKGDARPYPLHGLVVGCFKGAEEKWAGQANQEWRKGLVVKREVSNGNYDLEWISMERLKQAYGKT